MSDKTTIEWTDATFNPWWGCTKISPGCDNCYAEGVAKRFAAGIWGSGAQRREFMEEHWYKPVQWNARAAKAGKRMRVFCASMADVFDKDAPEGARDMLWDLIERTPWLDWQVLTKRIGNVAQMVPSRWSPDWPVHVQLGISVVTPLEVARDVPKLLNITGPRVRFLSCEPLLEAVDLSPYLPTLHWVIAGGESGHNARPMHPDWVRAIRDQCEAAGVPFLFKQWGEWAPYNRGLDNIRALDEPIQRFGKRLAGRMLDGRTWDGYPA